MAGHPRKTPTRIAPVRSHLVHNGIIENYATLKEQLVKEGHQFSSQTDTEVIVALLNHEWEKVHDYEQAVRNTLKKVRGSYAVVIVNELEPDVLIAAKKESPLILGFTDSAYFLASDVPAILPYTRQVVYLNDEEIVFISRNGYRIESLSDGAPRTPEPYWVDWNPIMAEKAGYKHFMLKEIYEQPRAVIDTFRSVVDLERMEIRFPELNVDRALLDKIDKICLVACGTSYHAALVAKYMFEGLCRVPVEVDLASEFRSQRPCSERKSPPGGDKPVRGNRRHQGRPEGRPGQGGAMQGNRERGRKQHSPDGPGGYLYARGPGNRGGFHQGIYHAARRPLSFRDLLGIRNRQAAARPIRTVYSGPDRASGQDGKGPLRMRTRSMPGQENTKTTKISSTSPGASVSDRPRRRAEAQGNLLYPCRRAMPPAK